MSVAPRHQQGGFVAGLEALAFGVLIFVLGTLVVVNAWAVVDAKFAAHAAAREAVRAAVEAPDVASQSTAAHAAAAEVLATHDIGSGAQLEPVVTGLRRCQEVAYRVRADVPALLLPGIATRTRPFVVVAEHREIVDPYRSGLEATATGTPCG